MTVRPAARASRAPARDRSQTEARILQAVGEVLARDGFSGVGINAVAREAGVDKVLIYRYFGGLNELLSAWGQSGRFWPSVAELLGEQPQVFHALPLAERYARFFEHFIDGLRARPLTIEILAAEIAERNELTALLESEREAWGEQAARVLGAADLQHRPEIRATTLLLIAGVQYLLIRARRIRIFGGLNLRDDAAWGQFKGAIRALALGMFDA